MKRAERVVPAFENERRLPEEIMTNSEIFHEKVLSRGGRFQREITPEEVKNSYDAIVGNAQDLIRAAREVVPNVPEIYVDFIYNGNINAVAFKSDNRYFIGIYTGTIFMLRSIIGRMLSDARLFRYAGDASAERSDLGSLTGYTPDADIMYQKEELFTPRDQTRREYAAFLQHHAIMFLVGHELTHILHGHIDYLNARRGAKITSELALLDSRDEEERLERQSLELDADRRSIISRIDSLRMTLKSGSNGIAPWRTNQEDAALLIFDWAISLNILFRLFGDERFSHVDPMGSAYPPLPLRQMMCYASAIEAVDRAWDPRLLPTTKKALKMALQETEFAFATTLGENFNQNMMSERVSKGDLEHSKRIGKYLHTTVTNRLRPYTYEQDSTASHDSREIPPSL
jgi:hypothetical protein